MDVINQYSAIILAFLSIISYTFFSSYYEKTIRAINKDFEIEPLFSAAILYTIASCILIVLVLISGVSLGFDFSIPENVKWSHNLGFVAVMSVSYFIQIYSEAKCRINVNMGVFDMFFQLYIIVIVVLNFFWSGVSLSVQNILGLVFIVLMSIALLYSSEKSKIQGSEKIKMTEIGGFWAIISALFMGIALFADGEASNTLIFNTSLSWSRLSLFLFYEMITFLFPAMIAIIVLVNRYGRKTTFQNLFIAYNHLKMHYWQAAFFSTFQFVFSVAALTFPNDRIIVSSILGFAPVLSVLFDKNPRPDNQKKRELLFAFLIFTAIIFIVFKN
jgi:hypothetical protein